MSDVSISSLPEELFVHIFSFLGPKDLGLIARVSKLWNAVAGDDSLWKSLCQDWKVGEKPADQPWKQRVSDLCNPEKNVRAGRCTTHKIEGASLLVPPCRVGGKYAFLIRAGGCRSIVLWDPMLARVVSTLPLGKRICHMTRFQNTAGQECLALGHVRGPVSIWNPAQPPSSLKTLSLKGLPPPTALAIWPTQGGDWLAVGLVGEEAVRVWKGQGEQFHSIGEKAGVISLQVVNDTLAVLDKCGTLGLWRRTCDGFEKLWSRQAGVRRWNQPVLSDHVRALGQMNGQLVCRDDSDHLCAWDMEGNARALSQHDAFFGHYQTDGRTVTLIDETVALRLGRFVGDFRGATFVPQLRDAIVVRKTTKAGIGVLLGVIRDRAISAHELSGDSNRTEHTFAVISLSGRPLVALQATGKVQILDFRQGATRFPNDAKNRSPVRDIYLSHRVPPLISKQGLLVALIVCLAACLVLRNWNSLRAGALKLVGRRHG